MRSIKRALVYGLASVALAVAAGQAMAEGQQSAEEVTGSFYHWYMKQTANDDAPQPLYSGAPELQAHLSQKLLTKIDELYSSDDSPDDDYFMKSQDFMDSWVTDQKVTRLSGTDAHAVDEIKLGTGDEVQVLKVHLDKETAGWRIVQVDEPEE